METLIAGFGVHHDVGITVLRVAVGTFFTISGYHKLFNPERHASLRATLEKDGIPFIRFNEWWVPLVEFTFGLWLTLGFLTVISSVFLLVICLIATCTDGWKRIMAWSPVDKADVLDDLLYLPEVMYGLLLTVMILSGPGQYSIDAVIFK